jgi:signal transduction histidine kinase/CheY-like chemotaxis protein
VSVGESRNGLTLPVLGAYPSRAHQAVRLAHYYEQLASLARLAVDLTDPRELLQQVPVLAAKALDCDGAVVFLVESNQTELKVVSLYGLSSSLTPGQRIPNSDDGAAGFVLKRGDVVVVPDWACETRFAVPVGVERDALRSRLAVPLFDQGHVVGVLSASSVMPNHFAQDEVRFLQAVASVLATSLQRAQMEAQLRQAHKMESVGKLTGGIAHDFNNLLTVIQGSLQMAQEHARDDANLQELLQAATGASRRAADLTGKLLAFSRRQMLTPSRVEMGELLPSLIDLLRRTLGEKIAIVVEVEAACPPCMVDRVQLESALLNIAINARDAMPDGGELNFSCAGVHGFSAGTMNAQGLSATEGAESWVCISVTDTGSGMTDAVRDSAFEPFFTTKEAGRGTGLGLSSVYGFVRQSRGSINLESAPGLGTTVTLLLPAYQGEATQPTVPAAWTQSIPAGLRVLLVEDDAEVRAVAQRFLASLKCTVSAHSSAESAWSELIRGDEFELLLTDIELGPGMKGSEFARRARALRPSLPVLLTSGYSKHLADERREEPGRWPLLKKPFSKDELANAAALALIGGNGLGPPIANGAGA